MDGAVRRARSRAGFSLLELVIAISLASMVLVAVISMAAQMTRFHVDGIRSGTVTGWSLVSVSQMTKEIADANVLAYPSTTTTGANTLVACVNWSRLMPGKLDTRATANVTVLYYCYDSTNKYLRRYVNRGTAVTCPATPPAIPACDGTGSWDEAGVVATNVELNGGAFIFTRDDVIGGVRIRYIVGSPTPTTNRPQPIFTPFDIKVGMQKQYDNTVD